MSFCCQSQKIYLVSFVLNLYIVLSGHLFSLNMIKAGRVCYVLFFSLLCASQHMCRDASSRCAGDSSCMSTAQGGNCVCICVRVKCWYLVVLPSSAVNTSSSWFLEEWYLLTGRDPVGRWSCPCGRPVCLCTVGRAAQSHTHAGSVKKL